MSNKSFSVCLIKNSLLVGGAEKQLVLIANNLVNQGFQVHILFKNSEATIIQQINNKVKIKSFNNSNLKNIIFIYKYVKNNNIEIIHSWDLISSYFGFITSIFTSAKFINGSIRSAPEKISFKRNKVLRRQKYFARTCNRIGTTLISNSKAGLKSYGIKEGKKAFVLLNGYEPPVIQDSNNDPTKKLNIIMVANMRWKKDFRTLIIAGLIICENYTNINYYLVGDGPDQYKYKEMLKNNLYEDRFIFTGNVDKPSEYIQKSDIGLLINDGGGEGISNSIMEYMAQKKPVIATNIGGNPELVIHNKTGFLINPRDVNDLVYRLSELINKPGLRKEMGEEGSKYLKENFSVDKMTTSLIEIYNQVKL